MLRLVTVAAAAITCAKAQKALDESCILGDTGANACNEDLWCHPIKGICQESANTGESCNAIKTCKTSTNLWCDFTTGSPFACAAAPTNEPTYTPVVCERTEDCQPDEYCRQGPGKCRPRSEEGSICSLIRLCVDGTDCVLQQNGRKECMVPTTEPTDMPSTQPTDYPSTDPSAQPTDMPSTDPSAQPTGMPSAEPTDMPSSEPSAQPTDMPSAEPTDMPSSEPTPQPTIGACEEVNLGTGWNKWTSTPNAASTASGMCTCPDGEQYPVNSASDCPSDIEGCDGSNAAKPGQFIDCGYKAGTVTASEVYVVTACGGGAAERCGECVDTSVGGTKVCALLASAADSPATHRCARGFRSDYDASDPSTCPYETSNDGTCLRSARSCDSFSWTVTVGSDNHFFTRVPSSRSAETGAPETGGFDLGRKFAINLG